MEGLFEFALDTADHSNSVGNYWSNHLFDNKEKQKGYFFTLLHLLAPRVRAMKSLDKIKKKKTT